jgi:hypothetical protein
MKRLVLAIALLWLSAVATWAASPLRIGAVTWHAAKYAGKDVTLVGYLLALGDGYVYFSDEPRGRVGPRDLPVTGAGLDGLKVGRRYVITGYLATTGLAAANGNPLHLELAAPPVAKP